MLIECLDMKGYSLSGHWAGIGPFSQVVVFLDRSAAFGYKVTLDKELQALLQSKIIPTPDELYIKGIPAQVRIVEKLDKDQYVGFGSDDTGKAFCVQVTRDHIAYSTTLTKLFYQ